VGWAGFYVGGTVGWTFGSAKGDYTGALPPVPPPVPAMVFYTFDLKPSGPTVGGHAGYSWQNGPWVFGIEGDISGVFNAHDRAFDPAGSGRYDEVELLWTAHLRGRLGHVFGGCLWYVAGGLALAGVKASHLAPGVQLFSQDDVRTGYSIGGGAEKAFGNWRLRAEYLFDGFASKRYDWVAGTRYSNSDLSLHSVRVGFSYLFGR
jgi:opacity protein-like surface antigen